MFTKSKSIICILVLSLFVISNQPVNAKSVYAITDHSGSTITAYEINGTQIDYQADASNFGGYPIGITYDHASKDLLKLSSRV